MNGPVKIEIPLAGRNAEPPLPAAPRFAVLGAGTWGVTLADVLARNGHATACWDIDRALIERLAAERRHPRLEAALSPELALTADLPAALEGANVVVVVVPSRAMRQACQTLREAGAAERVHTFVICNKGIEQDSLLLMHEVLGEVLGAAAGARAGVLSGPSHAEEVSRGLPTTIVAAAPDPERARLIQQWFFRPFLRVYTCDDPRGVELGAALKNVIAIAVGISDGMGFGDNTRAALITRGLAELVRLGIAAGARLETFMGLSGIGDLVVTATSRHSRNHTFGTLLAQGKTPEEALRQVGMVVEGYDTVRAACQLAQSHGVELPITQIIHAVLFEGLAPQRAVEELLAREPKPEQYR